MSKNANCPSVAVSATWRIVAFDSRMEPPSRSARFSSRSEHQPSAAAWPSRSLLEHEDVVVGEPGAQLTRCSGSGALRADPGATASRHQRGASCGWPAASRRTRLSGDPHAIGLCEPRDHLDLAFQLVGRHGAEGVPHILVDSAHTLDCVKARVSSSKAVRAVPARSSSEVKSLPERLR